MAEPYIPVYITVHLGRPGSDAQNVTVTFPEYIKNVASSEIYPTWPDSSIRANVYAQISFALNRIYTEWYPSQGYDFDITSSTAFDQNFVFGREIFGSINRVVDEIFNDYLRRPGQAEPLLAQYCNGTTVTCAGLSQWGTVGLAQQGMTPYEILTYYYGDNLEIVRDAPFYPAIPSYPGEPLRFGSRGDQVRTVQNRLNRVSINYPAIPKINPVDGIYGAHTENAVREFQRLFELEADGIVGKQTWYRLNYIYTSVARLAELVSEGERLPQQDAQLGRTLTVGSSGTDVLYVQYFLSVAAGFFASVPESPVTGTYTEGTARSMRAFQETVGLEPTGVVTGPDFRRLYEYYEGIILSLPPAYGGFETAPYPGYPLREGSVGDEVEAAQVYLLTASKMFPEIPAVIPNGVFTPQTYNAVRQFQILLGLQPDGIIGQQTWDKLTEVYRDIRAAALRQTQQYLGIDLGA